jgi:hypothetical protein
MGSFKKCEGILKNWGMGSDLPNMVSSQQRWQFEQWFMHEMKDTMKCGGQPLYRLTYRADVCIGVVAGDDCTKKYPQLYSTIIPGQAGAGCLAKCSWIYFCTYPWLLCVTIIPFLPVDPYQEEAIFCLVEPSFVHSLSACPNGSSNCSLIC